MDTNNNNYYYEEDDEISLLNLIGYVFRHLKKMLIVSIVAALVLGGLLGYKKSRVNEEEYMDNMETYLASKEVLDKNVDLAIKDLNNYIDESSFFELTAENSYQAKALYFVDTGYTVIPNSDYQNHDYTATVISAYINKVINGDVFKEIGNKYGISEKSVSDYISIYSHDYMIDVNVYYKSEKGAVNILHDLENVLISSKDDISSKITNNKISKITEMVYDSTNTNVIDIQQNRINVISDFIENLNAVQDQLNSLMKPETEKASFIKEFSKYGILGFTVMFLLMCMLYALLFIFSDKVYSSNEFKEKTNIKVLGNLKYDKNDKFINWINKLEKRPKFNNFDLVASNIKAYGNINKVLLSGDLEDKIKDDIVSNLKSILNDIEIISCGSLLTDSKAIDELNNIDGVILLVKCNKSTYKTIKEEKNKLDDLKVTNVYAIVVE